MNRRGKRLSYLIENNWDWERNGDLDPYTFGTHDETKVYWKCNNVCSCDDESPCEYFWMEKIKNMVDDEHYDCHICCRYFKKLPKCCHESLGWEREDLVEEYDHSKHTIGIYGRLPGEGTDINWICSTCGYEWETTINHRNNNSSCTGCPNCNNKVAGKGNTFADKYPNMLKYWDSEYPNNLKLNMLRPSSHEVVHFICTDHDCDCVHRYSNQPRYLKRCANTTHGCGLCSGRTACPHNNLTITHPKVTATFNPNSKDKYGDLIDVTQLTKGSEVYCNWICKKGHSYRAQVYNRVAGKGCPSCNNKTEGIVSEELGTRYNIQPQFRAEWCKKERPLPFDFMLTDYNIIVEIDGPQHFGQVSNWKSSREQVYTDTFKTIKALTNGYSVIRIQQDYVYANQDDQYWRDILHQKIQEIIDKPGTVHVKFISFESPELYDEHRIAFKEMRKMSIAERISLIHDYKEYDSVVKEDDNTCNEVK